MGRATLALMLTFALAPAGALADSVPPTSGAVSFTTNSTTKHTAFTSANAKSYTTYTASSPHSPKVRDQLPAPGAHLRTFYPQFSAAIDTFGAPLDRFAVHLYVDGQDVTDGTSVTQNTVSYIPRARVSTGWHDVFLEGADTAGQTFSDAWVFQSAAPDTNIDPPETAGFSFFPVGGSDFSTWGGHGHGGFMHFFFQSPFFGTPVLQLCGAPVTGTFIQVPFAPVFFTTVAFPAGTVGGALTPFLGCGTAGVVFTPNQLNFGTVFVPVAPIGIAGPAVTPNIPSQWSTRSMQPGLRSVQLPTTPSMSVPVPNASIGTYRSTMPVYRVVPNMVRPMPMPNAMPMMRSVMPVMRVPMPAARPMAPPPPVARPIPH